MAKKIIAIDIGGTNVRVALFDKKMNKEDYLKVRTNVHDPVDSLQEVIRFIKKHRENLEIIGISAPGPANYEEGYFYESTNLLGWSNFQLFDFLSKECNFSVKKLVAQNDANLMALAHHHYFEGTINDITQFFTISTGLGAGLIIKNEVFVGASGLAQEVAFAPTAWVKEAGKGLGQGSVEFFASGSGLETRAKQLNIASSAKELFELFETSLPAQNIINDGIEALANMIATSAALINPSLVVFDGSVARYNRWYVEKAIALARERMFEKQWLNIKFKFGELGDDAALIGAFHLAKFKSGL